MKGLRDRVLLLIGFAGAFRRSELVALDVEDLEESELGFKVTIRHSKTDQEGAGQTIAIVRGSVACAVAALKAWLDAAGITTGPIFRAVKRGGTVGGRLPAQTVAEIVKIYAERVGLDPTLFAGSSRLARRRARPLARSPGQAHPRSTALELAPASRRSRSRPTKEQEAIKRDKAAVLEYLRR